LFFLFIQFRSRAASLGPKSVIVRNSFRGSSVPRPEGEPPAKR
jgi:hypothetical protein